MARQVIQTALAGQPDMTRDGEVQRRKRELVSEAMVIVDAVRHLGGGATDPLTDVEVLARAVEIGLLDAPQLKGNPHACGKVRTRPVDGAILAVDASGKPMSEKERVASLFHSL
jgi:hypothetical protein